tara:strand:- start:29 stop:988 length:960 start_codon:yes stop_codon:yes gene_type:complete
MAGYLGNIPTPQATQTRDTFTATSGQTSFATSGYTVGMLDVYLNGVKLSAADITATNGSDVVLASGASADDILEVVSFSTFESDSGTFTGAVTVGSDLTVDTSTLKVDSSNNRVGIGTASPTSALHVSGGAGTNIAIQSSAGTHWRIGDGVGSTNGNLVIYDYSDSRKVFEIDTLGHITMPNQSAFLVHSAGQSNITTDTQVALTMGTEVFDNNADYSSNTFTAPVTGRYQFNWHVRFDALDSAATYYRVYLATSNRTFWTVYRVDDVFNGDADYWSFNGSHFTDMEANDTAQLGVFQAGGTQQTDIDNETHFSGFLVC